MSVVKLPKSDLASLEEAQRQYAANKAAGPRLTILGIRPAGGDNLALAFGRTDRPGEVVDLLIVDQKIADAVQKLINSL